MTLLCERHRSTAGFRMAAATRFAAYNVSRAKFGQVSNVMRLSRNYGEDKEIYDGVDVPQRAAGTRHRGSGRTSTGRTLTDSCFVVDSRRRY